MPEVHKYIGFAVVAIFTVGWVWGLVAAVARRDPGPRFWVWLTVAQIVAGIQAVVGVWLLILGYRPATWLHLVYGFGPLVIFLIGHGMARELAETAPEERAAAPWVVFAFAAFICFGLTGRALMTGLVAG